MDEIAQIQSAYRMLDHLPLGMALLRRDYTVLFWNRRLEEWTGIPRKDLLGTSIIARFGNLGDPRYTLRLQDIFNGGPPTVFSSQLHRFTIHARLPDGRERIQHTTVTPVPDTAGTGYHALLAIEDVTELTYRIQQYRSMRDQALAEIGERKRAENELRQAHEELELRVQARTKDLSALTERLRREMADRRQMESELLRAQKMESLGVLAGGISHDFNNLLTAVLGNVSVARRLLRPEEAAHERLVQAEKACLRARELTRQLLTFSKGGSPITKTASIAELVKESANFIIRGSAVKCAFDLAEDLAPVEMDEGQMSQVISNLIVNADQAMPDGGLIFVKAENTVVDEGSLLPLTPGRYVKISVRDKGVGISAASMENIFDPYFTTKEGGTGLGLTISYAIVKKHHGHMTVESQPGQGAVFSVYLPVSAEHAASPRPAPVSVRGSGKVLVMDDEEMVRTSAQYVLRDLGYEADFARDGQEAVALYTSAKAEGRPYTMVIIDLTVPGAMGGKETIKKLMAIDPAVKAIVSSGYADDPVMSEFRHYGFLGVVEKPYTHEELAQALHRVLHGPGA